MNRMRRQQYSYAMNATYNLMDADGYGDFRVQDNGISDFDVDMFITLHDAGNDKRLDKDEFMQAINNTLFMLVLEDALQSADPTRYTKVQPATHTSIASVLFQIRGASLGTSDLQEIIKFFDSDSDGRVSRKDIRSQFLANRAEVTQPFANQLRKVLARLDSLTYRSKTVVGKEFEYYYGGRD